MKRTGPDTSATANAVIRYNATAGAYQNYWTPVLHPLACALVDELPTQSLTHILDLGTGIGTLLPTLRHKFPGAAVTGVDLSSGMLALADTTESIAVMDALRLGIRAAAFDTVVMAFMLFHMPNPIDVLKEVRRVLRPGGTVAICTWMDDAVSPASLLWQEELDAHGAIAHEEIPEISFHDRVDTPKKVEALLESAGFAAVRAQARKFTHHMPLEEMVGLNTGVGASRIRYESLGAETQKAFLEAVKKRLVGRPDTDFTLRIPLVFANARSCEPQA